MNGYTFERRELKYRITDAQRAALEAAFGARMVPDKYGESTICNIYYDTADYRLIRASLEKPAYKEKLRLRSYGVTEPGGEVFLELKKKYKGIVYKRRITPPEDATGEFIAGRARSVNTPQSSQQPQRKTAAAVGCRKSLAEFAPAGANKVQSIFAGGVYVGKNTFLTSSNGGGDPSVSVLLRRRGFPRQGLFNGGKMRYTFLYLLEQGAMPL